MSTAELSPNDETCESMILAVEYAAYWDIGAAAADHVDWLCWWVKLRMRAYADGGWDGEQDVMVEWIAMDLALDEDDARRLCNKAGWV